MEVSSGLRYWKYIHPLWNAYGKPSTGGVWTSNGIAWFKKHLTQQKCGYQVDKLIWHFYAKYLLPLWQTLSENHPKSWCIWIFTPPWYSFPKSSTGGVWISNGVAQWNKVRVRDKDESSFQSNLRGNCTPNQKLTCFVLYLKIINTFLKNASYSKLSEELKKGIAILVDQAVFKL